MKEAENDALSLSKGYKQTEVGLIPGDWEVKKLGDIAFIKRGKFTPRPRNNPIYYGGNIPFVQTGDVTKSNGKIINYTQTLNEEGLAVSALFRKGTILMTIAANIGYTGILQIDMACPDSLVAIDGIKTDNEFLSFYFSFKREKLEELATTGAQMNLNIERLSPFRIPLPPTKAEQTAIATALSDADALISSLEKLIAKKRNIKQGAMQKLLQPKEGWLNKSLGEIGEITGAGADKLIVEGETPVRLVNYMDVFKRDFIYSKELNHWVTAPIHKANKCSVKQGDIFFTPSSEMRYDIAVSAVAMEDISDAVYSYHLVRLRLFEDWDLHFRTYIFKTKYFLGQAEQVCEGSGKRYVITLPKFRSLKIFYPPTKDEQTRIATILSDMDAEISALEAKLEKYKKVKLGMMQNLLTGKIRLV
jgi:type I restriction enzyme, S subunit